MPNPSDLRAKLNAIAATDPQGASGDTWSEPGDGAADGPGDGGAAEQDPAISARSTSGTPVDVGDRYTDLGAIGAGGWGEVRRVRDPRLHRVIARKQLHQKIASSSEAVARFLDEARVTAYLDHPGVVPVHELGRNADGSWYFTMKEVQGRTLGSVMTASREGDDDWPLVRVVEAFRRSCEAVAFAHARGVVHRDLKPGNIMVGEYGEAFVLDWGLARRPGGRELGKSLADDTLELVRESSGAKTLAGARVGTPQYMSPEHASGIPGRVDARSDVFSLGCILYEILTGRRALEGETVSELLGSAAMARVATIPATDAPNELISIAMKALAREPLDRYASAEPMADDLGAWLGGAPVRAHRYSPVSALRRFVGRHRAAFMVGGIAAALLAGSGALAVVRLADERDRALVAEAATEAALATAMAQRAEAALDGVLRPDADLLAAAALNGRGEPLARGVVLALAAKPHPRLLWEGWGSATRSVVSFGPDGRTVYLQDSLGQFAVLDAASQGTPRQIGAISSLYLTLEATASGLLVGGGNAANLKLLDPATFAVRRSFGGPGQYARVVHAIDGGAAAISVAVDDAIRTWSLADGTLQRTIIPGGPIRDAQATASTIYASTGEGAIQLWSRTTGEALPPLPDSDIGASLLRVSPDGRWLACGGGGGVQRRLAMWDLASGSVVYSADPSDGQVRTMAWSPDSQMLVTGLAAGIIEVRLAPSWQRVISLHGTEGALSSLAFSPDGSTLASSDVFGHVRTWDMSELGPAGEWTADARPVRGLAVARTGEIATLHTGGTVVVRGPDGLERRRFETTPLSSGQLVWVAGDTQLALTVDDDAVVLVDAQTGATARRLEGAPGRTQHLAVSPDGTVVAASGPFDDVVLWDLHSGAVLGRVSGKESSRRWRLAFSPDGRWLAATGEDGGVQIIDVAGRVVTHTLHASGLQAFTVAFSPDSARLAMGTPRGTTEIWDVATQRRTETLPGPAAAVESVAWTTDGLVLVAMDAGGVGVWRGETQVARIPVPAAIKSVTSTPDAILAISADGVLYRWQLSDLVEPAGRVGEEARSWSGMKADGSRVGEDRGWGGG